MFNTIVISCIFLSLLGVCKKNSQLDNLSNSEIAIMKYLLTQPTLSAWLPNETAILLLIHKGYIEIVCNKRKKI